ncbi:MAG: T9SS type A sorting domain-containing protein [Calditrichaeota bacterium]|nr:T9SS type A sorting domain-containing protein [Calditrichota bacterium]
MKRSLLIVLASAMLFSPLLGQKQQKHYLPGKGVSIRMLQPTTDSHDFGKPGFNDLLFESFESNFPPTGWSRISFGNSNKKWTQYGGRAKSGRYFAGVWYCSSSQTNNEWLITPAITLSNNVAAKLLFWERGYYWPNDGIGHFIKISTTSQSDTNSFQTISEMHPNNHTLGTFEGPPIEVDLSNYVGQTVYIAFVYYGSDADVWFVDDVTVREPQDNDLAIDSFSLLSHYDSATPIAPQVSVRNVGINSESFPVNLGYFNWDGVPVIIDTKQVNNLGSGQTQTVSFSSFVPDTNSEKKYFAAINLPSDMDSRNDSALVLMNTFTHEIGKALVEKGTGTWCIFCPGSALAIDSLYKLHPDQLAILEYHADDSFEVPKGRQRLEFYDIWAFPTAIFNGVDRQIGGTPADGDWRTVFNQQQAIFQSRIHDFTGMDIVLNVTENGGQFTATATITCLGNSLLKTYYLFFGLNESHIYHPWKGLDSLQFVARDMFPDANGLNILNGATPPAVGTTITRSVQFTLPSDYVRENCQLIAFVQEITHKQVAAVDKVDLGNLQNCLLGDVNMDNDITPGDALCAFQIYLNGGQLPAGDCNNPCALEVSDVNCTPNGVTPGDALNIFLAYLEGQEPPMDCLPAFTTTSEAMSLTFSEAENQDANSFSVDVYVDNPLHIQAFGAEIGYPENVLEFESVEVGKLTETWETLSSEKTVTGAIRVGGYHTEAITQNTPGSLFRIHFRKKENVEGSGEIFLYNLKDNISDAQTMPFLYSSNATDVRSRLANKLPDKYDLLPNYPNPFNMETKIRYQVPHTSNVKIQILNMRGQAIRNLVDGQKIAGRHVALWNGRDEHGREAASGIYWCRMKSGKFIKSVKLILMK